MGLIVSVLMILEIVGLLYCFSRIDSCTDAQWAWATRNPARAMRARRRSRWWMFAGALLAVAFFFTLECFPYA